MASWVVEIYAWSTIWNFFDLTRPQHPPTEKVLKFNISFHDSVKFFFSKHQNKVILVLKWLNSRTWKTLKSTVVIFQVLETSRHTGSSWADFNHGLVVRPQGCQWCQKIHKNILQINLLSYCANIQPILKKLQKTSRSHQKWLIFGRTS